MKIVKRILVAIALVASANMASAGNNGDTQVGLIPISGKKVAVSIQTKSNDVYRLKLKNEEGQIIYETKTDKSGNFQKVLDLVNLEDGNYALLASNTDSKAERKFSIVNGSILIGDYRYASAPVFTYRDNVLRVAYLNYEDEPMTITVYNENDNVVYSKEINTDFAVNEGINFGKVTKGNYQVIFGNSNESYSYSVKK
ncbi:MAG: hypothetical protein ACK5IJ_09495 [Mangrovibacterium sp.]